MRAALISALLIAGGAAAAEPPRSLGRQPGSPEQLLHQVERCAGLFIYSAAAASKSEGWTAEAAGRVNRKRAVDFANAAPELRRRIDGDAPERNVAAAVAQFAGLYARRLGGMEPPHYHVAVKDVLNQSDRTHCLSLQGEVRELSNGSG